jgi:hypothetical protein
LPWSREATLSNCNLNGGGKRRGGGQLGAPSDFWVLAANHCFAKRLLSGGSDPAQKAFRDLNMTPQPTPNPRVQAWRQRGASRVPVRCQRGRGASVPPASASCATVPVRHQRAPASTSERQWCQYCASEHQWCQSDAGASEHQWCQYGAGEVPVYHQ